jgi:hypothetical protein
MAAVFALRLAAGMLACLLVLPRRQVHPRYYRTHFVTALGLAGLATAFAWNSASTPAFVLLLTGVALAFIGSVVWSIEGAPAGLAVVVLTVAALGAVLWLLDPAAAAQPATDEAESVTTAVRAAPIAGVVATNITSSALLGAALSAMLMGHAYLIAPGMTLSPLLRLTAAVALALLARGGVDAWALWRWTLAHPSFKLGDEVLWLPLRWLAGFVLPLILTWMAWQSARIRSTQSATGILYVVVTFCFLGELTDQLLRESGVTF